MLDDRKVPRTRGNIDHLVVAPSCFWIVDAKNYTGKVEYRDAGGWFRTVERLYVGGRDKTSLVSGVGWQVDAVRAAFAGHPQGEAPVRPVLCFTSSDWPLFAKPFTIGGLLACWPAALTAHLPNALPASD